MALSQPAVVLLVDQTSCVGSTTARLRPAGIDVLVCHRVDEARDVLTMTDVSLVLLREDLPRAAELLAALAVENPATARFVCVDQNHVPLARHAIASGAIDGYVSWPCTGAVLETVVRVGLDVARSRRESTTGQRGVNLTGALPPPARAFGRAAA